MVSGNGAGPLRQVIEAARAEGASLKDLTVLSAQRDPYRIDTPAMHRDGRWFAAQLEWAKAQGMRRPHLRGLHYAISQAKEKVLKPNGEPYLNNDEDWQWFQDIAAKAARWLGYVRFDAFRDQKNEEPVVVERELGNPFPYVSVGIHVEIPDVRDIEPYIGCSNFRREQPYHLVIFGEKSSLEDVVAPIARNYSADLYLMTGEISDTRLYQMARNGAEDGRPMRVFTLSDFDPAGYHMPIGIARKLQAFRDLEFHELDFEVRPVSLTVDQVRELGLPSTPLKETERRADKWREAWGLEQVEIDALATLQPTVLRKIVQQALDPFFDHSLWGRVHDAHLQWERRARRIVAENSDADFIAEIREVANEKLAEVESEIEALNESLRQAVPDHIERLLPPVVIPEPELDEGLHGMPLLSSSWSWTEQTRALIERKSYGNGAA